MCLRFNMDVMDALHKLNSDLITKQIEVRKYTSKETIETCCHFLRAETEQLIDFLLVEQNTQFSTVQLFLKCTSNMELCQIDYGTSPITSIRVQTSCFSYSFHIDVFHMFTWCMLKPRRSVITVVVLIINQIKYILTISLFLHERFSFLFYYTRMKSFSLMCYPSG